MTQQYIPLVSPDLTYKTDLRPYIYDTIRETSNNTIYDFSAHSPVVAIVEGVDFCIREIQSVLNQYALVAAIDHLKIAGVQQRLGTPSKVTLEFVLSTPLNNPFYLSKGYIVSATNSFNLQFTTDDDLIIYPGNVSGRITATATDVGTQYNLGINQITNLTQASAYLQSVTNIEPSIGGSDAETYDQTIERGFTALRSRNNLITADDFEQTAMAILGFGSLAKAIGNLGSDGISFELGTVHIFALNSDGSTLNDAQCSDLVLKIKDKTPIMISTSLSVSSIVFVEIYLNIVCSMISGDNSLNRSQEIYNSLIDYFTPNSNTLGRTIILKEVENVIRQTGVKYVQSVFFNTPNQGLSYSDFILPNVWSAVKLKQINISLVDDFNNSFEYVY